MNTITDVRQVQVPHTYFQKAKSEYSDWRWAMIREFIQNAYDAQAAYIDFLLTANEAGRIELQVSDDGTGMDRDTLENVLLCMGGSRKLAGSIGGFGYAKAILFFAHHRYAICTRNLRVDGSGGEYRLTEESTAVSGTRMTVELADDSSLLDAWRERIKGYVAACFMEFATGRPVAITLDGVVLPQNNDGLYDFAVKTSLGDLWYDEQQGASRSAFVVTVAGLPMFIEAIYSSTNQSALSGGLELDAGSAALTANRDGFTSTMRDQFAKIVGELVQNQSAVRYGQALDLSINFDDFSAISGSSSSSGPDTSSESCLPPSAPLLLMCPQTAKPDAVAGYAAALGRITHDRYPANFHLKVESLAVRRSANSQAYITAPLLVAEMNKQRTAKLAHSWRAAISTILCCDWALKNGATFYDQQGQLIDEWESDGADVSGSQAFFRGRRVDAGFCFIANAEGLCSTPLADGSPHRIFINPLLLTAETRHRHSDLLDLAFHELAHLWEQHHGEAFCGVEGKLRQSVRRWLSEREVLARLANAVPNG
jgi:hypothetical protein